MLEFIQVLGFDAVDTLVVEGDNLFMGKFILSKGRLYMALVGAIDQLGDRIVGDSGNIGMTLPAVDQPVNAFVVKLCIDVVIPALSVFIDSADESMSMTHQAIFYIRSFSPGTKP